MRSSFFERAPGTLVLEWENADEYEAEVSPSGVAYAIFSNGPAGGPGMAGSQSLEDFLAIGPLDDMPAAQVTEARAVAGRAGVRPSVLAAFAGSARSPADEPRAAAVQAALPAVVVAEAVVVDAEVLAARVADGRVCAG